MTPKELKQHISGHGFQVFRTLGHRLVLADRVRENLIMDSGVSVDCRPPHRVRVVVRAQARDYPDESAEQLFRRAREFAKSALGNAYQEVEAAVVEVDDPSGSQEILDTWYQVSFEKAGLQTAVLADELRHALSLKKLA